MHSAYLNVVHQIGSNEKCFSLYLIFFGEREYYTGVNILQIEIGHGCG